MASFDRYPRGGRLITKPRMWMVSKDGSEVREISDAEFIHMKRVGTWPPGAGNFFSRERAEACAERRRAEAKAAQHVHAFAVLAAGQFDLCQLCGVAPPARVCTDCDLEACAACTEPKGDRRG